CFLLGSTVVMLWPKDTITFNPQWMPEQGVRMGETMGRAVFKTAPSATATV
ncbi:MAG: phosphatidylserine decarboxylase, partial [Comamonadaceae bacterium]|nr:phosphatidylserine decarboxylase [Comamonadaceae bacterium]